MIPSIQATLARKDFAIAESILFTLSVTNTSTAELLAVADPRRGGDSLRFQLRFPNGQELPFTIGEALQAPGVKQIPIDMRVPPGVRQDFEFDLVEFVRLEKVGRYGLKVLYEWKKGEPTWTAEFVFSINAPASSFLEAVPVEAALIGNYGILWTEPEGNRDRVLLADYRIERSPAKVRQARQIARVQTAVAPGFSMSPAGLPFSERWLAWLTQGQLHTLYHAETVEHKLGVSTMPIAGASPRLVRPLLAEPAPDEGRPRCLLGVITDAGSDSATLATVEINRKGEARTLPALSVAGNVLDAWATAPNAADAMFIVATRSGKQLEIQAISCSWGGEQGKPTMLFSTEAELASGDVRATLEGQVWVGLLLKRGERWERLSFVVPLPGAKVEPRISPLSLGSNTTAVRSRLDSGGGLHLLLRRGDRLSYIAPDESADKWLDEGIARTGKFLDLLLRPDFPAVLIYYDPERGPLVVRL